MDSKPPIIEWEDLYKTRFWVGGRGFEKELVGSRLLKDGKPTGIRIDRAMIPQGYIWIMSDGMKTYGGAIAFAYAKLAMAEVWKEMNGLVKRGKRLNKALLHSDQKELPL